MNFHKLEVMCRLPCIERPMGFFTSFDRDVETALRLEG
jgi:hypothetical protein